MLPLFLCVSRCIFVCLRYYNTVIIPFTFFFSVARPIHLTNSILTSACNIVGLHFFISFFCLSYSGTPFLSNTTTAGARRFSDLRNDWLAGGDVARSTQTNYTVRVERIPRAFRSPAMLQKFFSTLFPGQVRAGEGVVS